MVNQAMSTSLFLYSTFSKDLVFVEDNAPGHSSLFLREHGRSRRASFDAVDVSSMHISRSQDAMGGRILLSEDSMTDDSNSSVCRWNGSNKDTKMGSLPRRPRRRASMSPEEVNEIRVACSSFSAISPPVTHFDYTTQAALIAVSPSNSISSTSSSLDEPRKQRPSTSFSKAA
jgi:hypothetical protein